MEAMCEFWVISSLWQFPEHLYLSLYRGARLLRTVMTRIRRASGSGTSLEVAEKAISGGRAARFASQATG